MADRTKPADLPYQQTRLMETCVLIREGAHKANHNFGGDAGIHRLQLQFTDRTVQLLVISY